MIGETISVGFGCFEHKMLCVENRIVANVDGNEAVIVEDLAGKRSSKIRFGFVVHVISKQSRRWRDIAIRPLEYLIKISSRASSRDLEQTHLRYQIRFVGMVECPDRKVELICVVNK